MGYYGKYCRVCEFAIIKDFYANLKLKNETPLARIDWIRGREVPYDKEVIHLYIQDNYVAHHRKLDLFLIQLEKGNWKCDQIVIDISELGKAFHLGQTRLLLSVKRSDMTIQAQIWMKFLINNVIPLSYTRSTTLKTTQLIWYIIKGK